MVPVTVHSLGCPCDQHRSGGHKHLYTIRHTRYPWLACNFRPSGKNGKNLVAKLSSPDNRHAANRDDWQSLVRYVSFYRNVQVDKDDDEP